MDTDNNVLMILIHVTIRCQFLKVHVFIDHPGALST